MRGFIGDGAYDSRCNFNLLDEKGIEPIIKVRRNTVKGLRDAHSYKIGYRFNVKVVDGEV